MSIVKKILEYYNGMYDASEFEGRKTHLGTLFALFAIFGVGIFVVIAFPPAILFIFMYMIYLKVIKK